MSTTATRQPIKIDAPRWDFVRRSADRLTKDFSAPAIPVLDLAELSGVDVVFDDFGDFSDRLSGYCDFEERRIYVNSDDYLPRQLFTIAHELGHWILHKPIWEKDPDAIPVLPRFEQTDPDNPVEQEANKFAANLLVPTRLLKPVRNASVSKLAETFKVSKQMMEIRLKDWRVRV